MSALKIPRTLAEEKEQHGFFWRINTIFGFTIYNALCSFIIIPYTSHLESIATEKILQFIPITFGFIYGVWLAMLLPGILLRTAYGKRGGMMLGWLASFAALLILSGISVAMGERIFGPLMLLIFITAPYKVVCSHFGLRALGIPLSLPEWREPALIPFKEGQTKRGSIGFSPFLRVLYCLTAFGGLAAGATAYFSHVGDGLFLTLLSLLPAYHLGRFALDAFEKTFRSYRCDRPEKALCYAIIGILTCGIWSMAAISVMAFCPHHSWNYGGTFIERHAVFSLLFVAGLQMLIALYRYLCKRFPKREAPPCTIPAKTDTPAEPYRPTLRATKGIVFPCLALILLLLVGGFGYLLRRDVRRFPQKYSDTMVKYLANEAYNERLMNRRYPDVDVLPAYCTAPAEYEIHAAKHIAAIYLQKESPKYSKLLEAHDDKKNQAVMLYTSFFGEDANIYTICRYVISELPPAEQEDLMEELSVLSSATWNGTEDKEAVLNRALRKLAYHRYHHPEEQRHGGVKPCSSKELERATQALVSAVNKQDAEALQKAIAAGGDIETEVFLHFDKRCSYDVRKQKAQFIPLLHYVLQEGFVEGAEILLKNGAVLRHGTTSSPDCWKAVSLAKDKEKQRELIRLLRRHGLQPNASSRAYLDSDLQEECR